MAAIADKTSLVGADIFSLFALLAVQLENIQLYK
jgi:hypothetical protein